MSSTDSSGDDHAYFQAIEKAFIRLRGAPLLLSPADWQLASRWHREGLPLELVLETLEKVFDQRAARGAKGKVQGLRYCAAAIEAAWQEQTELQATGKRQSSAAMDVPGRLQALAQAVTHVDLLPSSLATEIRQLEGSPEEVEQALIELDRQVIDMAVASLDEVTRREIRQSIAKTLADLTTRLGAQEAARVRDRLFHQSVRRRLGLPVLSLFATDGEIHPA